MNYIPLVVLALVYALISVRRIGGRSIEIWQAMGIGAFLVLVFGQISPIEALKSINLDVIVYIIGMLIIGEALHESGYLNYLLTRFFSGSRTAGSFILKLVIFSGMSSVILMNDTLAVLFTPFLVSISKDKGLNEKMMLLALAFSITVGSVMSPIGNPQNLLIALRIQNPFPAFLFYLSLPTLINLLVIYLIVSLSFKKETIKEVNFEKTAVKPKSNNLETASKLSLWSLVILSIANSLAFTVFGVSFPISLISLLAAVPIIFSGRKGLGTVIRMDWRTVAFFAFMFILMQSVFDSGIIQLLIHGHIGGVANIMLFSLTISQVLSNVPFVALFIRFVTPTLANYLALAAGSTIAGNFLILGAASNIIIIQSAERYGGKGLSFTDFIKYGMITALINFAVYWAFLILV
ncbi:MAG: anion transporter [Nitrososphaerota archaeon]|nr:SLC13 family permease [Nitrososphaerota archaeon]MDG6927100.1 anion transporter [Nitrososphaerota archaeon]MDG6929899.1 anion transporter [Nitrososphaerota archaeon]MDG6932333.1 anion transporter [Nitrososphaerota archaeon]MDG6935892.1 anion transporter [Nitrososphaerota archaeon]